MAEKKKREPVDFAEVLTDLDSGEVARLATEQWRKLVQTVKDTNKSGSLTIRVDVKSDRGAMVLANAKVTTKLPTRATTATALYTDDEGNTALFDLQQEQLKFVRSPASAAEKDA